MNHVAEVDAEKRRAKALCDRSLTALPRRGWSAWSSDYVLTARGQALREHASVLSSRGLYREALPFLENAGRTFAQIDAASADLARLAELKATVRAETGSPIAAPALPVCAY